MARPKKYSDLHKFIRKCPTCGIEIIYKKSSQYFQAERVNRKCRKCGCGWASGQTKETNESIKKMGQTVSKKLKGRPTWNKGLTKNDHPSLIVVGEKRKNKKHSLEALKKISEASKEHWKTSKYRKLVSERIKEMRGLPEVVDRWRTTCENNGHFTPLEKKSEWDKYVHLVWYYTNKNDLTTLDGHDRRGRVDLNDEAYHLDHIVSITDGFNKNVPPEIIGSICNLRFIPANDNMKKKQKSHMSINELYELYQTIVR